MTKAKKNVTPIPGLKKIYSLNNYENKPFLYKYISFEHLKKNMNDNKIVFVSPQTWQDPFEQIYYAAKYKNYKKPNIFCMCLTENLNQHEAAAWKMYQDGTNDKMIKVYFNVTKMLEQLDEFCRKNEWSIYIGKINYDLSSREIQTLSMKTNPYYEQYFPENFSNEDYLNLLLLKRKAFEFEQEVRMFLIPDDKNPALYSKDLSKEPLYRIPEFNYNNAIKALKIAPLQPFALEDPRQKYYDTLQRSERLIYKEALENLLQKPNSIKIKQSFLYRPKNKTIINIVKSAKYPDLNDTLE